MIVVVALHAANAIFHVNISMTHQTRFRCNRISGGRGKRPENLRNPPPPPLSLKPIVYFIRYFRGRASSWRSLCTRACTRRREMAVISVSLYTTFAGLRRALRRSVFFRAYLYTHTHTYTHIYIRPYRCIIIIIIMPRAAKILFRNYIWPLRSLLLFYPPSTSSPFVPAPVTAADHHRNTYTAFLFEEKKSYYEIIAFQTVKKNITRNDDRGRRRIHDKLRLKTIFFFNVGRPVAATLMPSSFFYFILFYRSRFYAFFIVYTHIILYIRHDRDSRHGH